MFGGPGGSWDVQHVVPIKGFFFLSQAQDDYIEPLGNGQSVPLFFELSEQTSGALLRHIRDDEIMRWLRMRRFDNICALAQAVPSHYLHLSLDGAFWEEIEHTITVCNNTT